MGKKKTDRKLSGPIPQLDEAGTVSATEMTGAAPVGLPEQPGMDLFNELWNNPTPMTGAHADKLPKTTKD